MLAMPGKAGSGALHASVIQLGFKRPQVLNHDLLGLRFGVHVLVVNLVTLQHLLDQRPATGNLQLSTNHTEVSLDDRLLCGIQAKVGLSDP